MGIREEILAYAKSRGMTILTETEIIEMVGISIAGIARGGIHPKEAAELLEKYIETYNKRKVYHESPRSPMMDKLLVHITARAALDRNEQ